MIVLLLFLLNFQLSAYREWVLPQTIMHGKGALQHKPETYKKGSIEYKILQLALDIESVLPTKVYDNKYKKKFMELIPVPRQMHNNFVKRQALYDSVKAFRKEGLLSERSGFLVPSKLATADARDIMKNENRLRQQLYGLIASYFKIKDEKLIKKIPSVYGDAITNLKYYIMLTREPSSTNEMTTLVSMTTAFPFNRVLKSFREFIDKKGEYSIIDPKLTQEDYVNWVLSYKHCPRLKVNFLFRACKVKHGRPLCKLKKAKSLLEGLLLNDGTLLWVEKDKSAKNTIYVNADKTEDSAVVFCNGHKFLMFDEFSKYLIQRKETK